MNSFNAVRFSLAMTTGRQIEHKCAHRTDIDRKAELRKAQENPDIKRLYEEVGGMVRDLFSAPSNYGASPIVHVRLAAGLYFIWL
jgi:hypothetical protein